MSLPREIQDAQKFKVRRVVQTIADLAGKPWPQLRIADLGSHEGDYSLEFAAHGARAVAIEGREESTAIARQRARKLGLSTIECVTEDVRNFSRERFGPFDVVLCAGILYHLPAQDGCRLVNAVAEACTRLVIIDTHIGQQPEVAVHCSGHSYHGDLYREFADETQTEEKRRSRLASLDNTTSVWLTYPSLLNLLKDAGFTSVYEIRRPHRGASYSDRIALAAVKGEPQRVTLYPELDSLPDSDLPEGFAEVPYPRGQVNPRPVPRWKILASKIKHRIVTR